MCQTVDVHDLPHDALQQSAVPVVDGGEQKLLLNFQKSNTLDVSLEYFTFLLDKWPKGLIDEVGDSSFWLPFSVVG